MTTDERFERIEDSLATVATSLAQVSVNVGRVSERLDQVSERMDRVSERLDRVSERLDRAVRLSVREARSERAKRRELDEKVTQLAAAQVITEEKLQGLIEALKRGGNGHV
jgi:DNA repair ATPase RecN